MIVKGNYINGQWVNASSSIRRAVINPATGQEIAAFADSTKEDVRQAVAAAKRSFYETREWRDMCPQERADVMLRIADKISDNREELARIESVNVGKPLREAECDADDAVHCFRYYAGLITKPSGEVYYVNKGFGEMHSYTVREPIGVCAQITPWIFRF
jgi:aldehyde dehydrogenase (acceptor) (EC 1.2.99.3)